MELRWHVLYYETVDGVCPVQQFINTRKDRDQAKIFSWLTLLEEQGPTLPRPYADMLGDGVHELRVKLTGDQVRILYFFCYREFIVLSHAFVKHTGAVPSAEIKRAQKYRDDFLARFDERRLREALNEEL